MKQSRKYIAGIFYEITDTELPEFAQRFGNDVATLLIDVEDIARHGIGDGCAYVVKQKYGYTAHHGNNQSPEVQ